MPAPLWRWCTAASLTAAYQSVWLTGRSHTALIKFHFEVSCSDSPIPGQGWVGGWGTPNSSCLFSNASSFWLIIEYFANVFTRQKEKKVHPETCSLSHVVGAWRLTETLQQFQMCFGLCVCVKSHSEGGVCVKRNTKHQEVLFISFFFFILSRRVLVIYKIIESKSIICLL